MEFARADGSGLMRSNKALVIVLLLMNFLCPTISRFARFDFVKFLFSLIICLRLAHSRRAATRDCSYLSGNEYADCVCKSALNGKAKEFWSQGDVQQAESLLSSCNPSSPGLRFVRSSEGR